jgi:hypothetical protein
MVLTDPAIISKCKMMFEYRLKDHGFRYRDFCRIQMGSKLLKGHIK